MKQTIKLTESKLRNIIKECIKKSLNELDARTYASYANKRRQQAQNAYSFSDQIKYTNKAEQGEDAARNAWNKKYGYSEDNRNGNTYGYNQEQMINTTDNPYQVHSQSMSKNDYEDRPYTNNVNNSNRGTSDAMRTAQQMANNSGTYIKGKGWQ